MTGDGWKVRAYRHRSSVFGRIDLSLFFQGALICHDV